MLEYTISLGKRKITVKSGRNGYQMTIPPLWVRNNDLMDGGSVTVFLTQSGDLLIRGPTHD
jgi:hypothetical protein